MHLLAPFETWAVDHPDFSPIDDRAEAQRQLQRDDAIEGFLRGEVPMDELLDMAQEHMGIGADAYIDMVEDNVNYVIDQGIRFDPTDSGLLLPRIT